MKITNKYNLPEPIYLACSQVWKPKDDSISVSNLILPPLVLYLTKKYWDQLEDDASNRLWALFGSGVHKALEGFIQGDSLAEEKLKVKISGLEVRGRLDVYDKKKQEIADYKVLSIFAFLLGAKPEFEKQENCYAQMLRSGGVPVKKLTIHAFLRDWSKNKRFAYPDMPEIPFQTIDIPLWSEAVAKEYMETRVYIHKNRPQTPCTDKEKWFRKGKIAIHKKGTKRALKLCYSMKEAQEWIKGRGKERPKDKLELVEREGVYTKCASFCNVRSVCPFGQSLITGEEEDE